MTFDHKLTTECNMFCKKIPVDMLLNSKGTKVNQSRNHSPYSLDINECTEGTDNCVNGSCVNTLGSYRCTCNPGWTGTICDTGAFKNS